MPVDVATGRISLPRNFCNLVTSREELIEKVFSDIQTKYKNYYWLSERAILAAKNKDEHERNNIIQSNKSRLQHTSLSTLFWKQMKRSVIRQNFYFVRSAMMPPHVLQSKIGVLIIMLLNSQSFATARSLQCEL